MKIKKALQETIGLTMYLIPCLDLINPLKKAMVTKDSWSCIVTNTAVKVNVFAINTQILYL